MPYYAPSTIAVVSDMGLGIRVDRAAALVTAATVNLFTVAGGRVRITAFLGEIVQAFPGTACTLQVVALTTDVTAVQTPLCVASADIQGMAAGRMFTLPADVGSPLVISTGSSAAVLSAAPWYELKTGGLQLVGSAAPASGTIKFSVWYLQVDDNAYMAVA